MSTSRELSDSLERESTDQVKLDDKHQKKVKSELVKM